MSDDDFNMGAHRFAHKANSVDGPPQIVSCDMMAIRLARIKLILSRDMPLSETACLIRVALCCPARNRKLGRGVGRRSQENPAR
jgi:hypothetical protein